MWEAERGEDWVAKCQESVISLVLSRGSKDLKWQTSVIVQLQLSFIWQTKDSKPSRSEGGLIPKESLGFLFLYVLSPPH